MTREMTNYEIIQVINKLDGMGGTAYPYKVTRAISKTLKALREEYTIYEKTYKELLARYYEVDDDGMVRKDENGEDMIKDPGKLAEATEAITDLLNEKVDVEITQFDESVLESMPTMTPVDYGFFDNYFIKSEED